MTTLAPVLDLVGDVESFSLFRYRSALWVAYIRTSGELELHRSALGRQASVTAVASGVATLTGLEGMNNDGAKAGRIAIENGASAGNNGSFPIVEYVSPTSVKISNASAVAGDANNGSIRWNAGLTAWTTLEDGALAPKAQIAAVAIGDVLCLAWRHAANGAIYFSLWSFATSTYVQAPIPLWVGASPSLKVYKSTGLVMAYVDGDGQHVYRISKDGGLSWSADPVVVDPINVLEVDLDVYPETENVAYWAERA